MVAHEVSNIFTKLINNLKNRRLKRRKVKRIEDREEEREEEHKYNDDNNVRKKSDFKIKEIEVRNSHLQST